MAASAIRIVAPISLVHPVVAPALRRAVAILVMVATPFVNDAGVLPALRAPPPSVVVLYVRLH
eukprot:6485464-Pyramimonas_sp.AAC.1